jgi:hypothetical protein
MYSMVEGERMRGREMKRGKRREGVGDRQNSSSSNPLP